MNANEMKEYLVKQYNEIVVALNNAEKEYNENRKSGKKRAVFEFISSRYLFLCDILCEMGIEYDDGLGY